MKRDAVVVFALLRDEEGYVKLAKCVGAVKDAGADVAQYTIRIRGLSEEEQRMVSEAVLKALAEVTGLPLGRIVEESLSD